MSEEAKKIEVGGQHHEVKQTPRETVEINGQHHEITGYTEQGVPIIQGHATSIHHTDEDGNLMYDEDNNPVRSVHVSVAPPQPLAQSAQVDVPPANIQAKPGKVE